MDVESRRKSHFSALCSGKHCNQYLQNAFNKYGKSSFEFHVIEKVGEDLLDVREKSWIAHYKSMAGEFGYNIEYGGNQGKAVLFISEETRKRMREAAKNRAEMTDQQRLKIAKSLKGRRQSENARRALEEARENRRLEDKYWVPE